MGLRPNPGTQLKTPGRSHSFTYLQEPLGSHSAENQHEPSGTRGELVRYWHMGCGVENGPKLRKNEEIVWKTLNAYISVNIENGRKRSKIHDHLVRGRNLGALNKPALLKRCLGCQSHVTIIMMGRKISELLLRQPSPWRLHWVPDGCCVSGRIKINDVHI